VWICSVLHVAACGGKEPAQTAAGRESSQAPPGDVSIYDLDLELVESTGGAIRLAALRDTVRVAAMMYTRCESVCPRLTADMNTVAGLLGEEERRRVGFVFFSLDPGHDSPEALRRSARRHRQMGLNQDPRELLAAVRAAR
jgi:protein SCO1/2